MKESLSDDIQKVADTLTSVAANIRRATTVLMSAAGEIKKVADTLTSAAEEVRAREYCGELSVKKKSKKTKKLARITAEREHKTRKAVKMYWKATLQGERITRQDAATNSGLEKTALSKNGFSKCMKNIRDAIEAAKAVHRIQRMDSTAITRLLAIVDVEMDEFLQSKQNENLPRHSGFSSATH